MNTIKSLNQFKSEIEKIAFHIGAQLYSVDVNLNHRGEFWYSGTIAGHAFFEGATIENVIHQFKEYYNLTEPMDVEVA